MSGKKILPQVTIRGLAFWKIYNPISKQRMGEGAISLLALGSKNAGHTPGIISS